MTVLSACQSAAIRLRGQTISVLYGVTDDQFTVELADLANEAARDIAAKADWQALTRLATITGDGTASSFDLPADFARMTMNAEVHSASWQAGRFRAVRDLNDWMDFTDTGIIGMPGAWTIFGGQIHFTPVVPNAATARFYYISDQVVSGGETEFTADADSFVLDERLLTLGIIWRWREMKRFEYAGDLENYAVALSEAITRDRGPRIIKVGQRRQDYGVRDSFPVPLPGPAGFDGGFG